jgi:hypothetical protein
MRTTYECNWKKKTTLPISSEASTGKSYCLDDIMQFFIPYIKTSKEQDGNLTCPREQK